VPEVRAGAVDRPPTTPSVAVVGGGLAGVAAAVALAEAGVRVRLFEAGPVLGGRVSAWPERLATGEAVEMDRGFHAFFRQYYNLRSLLRRAQPSLAFLAPVDDYPLAGPGGASESFSGLPRLPPLNVAALTWRTPTIGLRDLLGVDAGAALEMLRFDPVATVGRRDSQTAAEYLDELRFPPAARRMLFSVFAHSFFNRDDEMSAAELLAMFHVYFTGSGEGLLFDVCTEPFSRAIWAPLAAHVQRLGADVRVGVAVESVERSGAGWVVGGWGADAVVLAVPVEPLRRIVEASPGLGDPPWRASVGQLERARPFAVWRLWTGAPVAGHRPPFLGTAGIGILDNITSLDHYQGDSARWAQRSGGSVVELHAYALDHDAGEGAVKAELLASLHRLYPETTSARVLDERFLLRQDCPAFPPGSTAVRPGVATPDPGVVLAGDHVRLPFPCALMERAASSGFLAANHLLARWGLPQVPLWSVPPRGLLARPAFASRVASSSLLASAARRRRSS
jgi:isorenieratene synthase